MVKAETFFVEAVEWYEAAGDRADRDASAYANRGYVWLIKGNLDNAIADCSEAIRLDPEVALTFANRGRAWARKKEFDKAIADYTEAIRLDPRDASTYAGRGYVSEQSRFV